MQNYYEILYPVFIKDYTQKLIPPDWFNENQKII